MLFTEQNGWEVAKAYLDEVDRSGDYCMMSSVNLGEVYYSIIREKGKDLADEILDYILQSQIEVVFPTLQSTQQAAIFKSRGGASYADCVMLLHLPSNPGCLY